MTARGTLYVVATVGIEPGTLDKNSWYTSSVHQRSGLAARTQVRVAGSIQIDANTGSGCTYTCNICQFNDNQMDAEATPETSSIFIYIGYLVLFGDAFSCSDESIQC